MCQNVKQDELLCAANQSSIFIKARLCFFSTFSWEFESHLQWCSTTPKKHDNFYEEGQKIDGVFKQSLKLVVSSGNGSPFLSL